MTPDLYLAHLCLGAYQAPDTRGLTIDAGDVRAVLTDGPNGTLDIAIRGTRPLSIADWYRDFEAFPRWHLALGWCHDGFLTGAEALYASLRPHIAGRRCRVTGHSLGGALAVLVAGLMTIDHTPPDLVVTFEAPRAGRTMLRQVLIGARVAGRHYVYGNDPVPLLTMLDMHVWLPPIYIGAPAEDPFECHRIEGVIAWLEAHEPAAAGTGTA